MKIGADDSSCPIAYIVLLGLAQPKPEKLGPQNNRQQINNGWVVNKKLTASQTYLEISIE